MVEGFLFLIEVGTVETCMLSYLAVVRSTVSLSASEETGIYCIAASGVRHLG
jgi:hypothetical protein